MGRIVKYTLAGMLGAVVAWAAMEGTALMPNDERTVGYSAIFVVGLVSGLLIGAAMGVAEARSGLSPKDGARSILMGALVGSGGGVIGLTFGNILYNAFAGSVAPNFATFVLLLAGRGFGWALIGLFIGVSQGIATASTRRMRNGAIGGFLGGLAGGCVFEIMAWMNRGGAANFPPQFIRFISFGLTGSGIGFCIGLIEEVAKQAWLLRLVGRNEGREHTLYKPVTVIGRSEFADIPVFTDPDVVERHAAIITQGQRHYIEDTGSFFGTRVNGDKITQRESLRDGDLIEVGKTRFLFRDKATRRATGIEKRAPGTAIPTSDRICPFCGSVKDADGNCECSLGGPSANQVGAGISDTRDTTVHQTAGPAPDSSTQQGVPTQPAATPAQTGVPRIVGIAGPYESTSFDLVDPEIEIGRDSGRDIPLPLDNTVSRTHARIVTEQGTLVICDAGSTNGTYVNGARIDRHQLTPGDVIQVGSTKFRFDA